MKLGAVVLPLSPGLSEQERRAVLEAEKPASTSTTPAT